MKSKNYNPTPGPTHVVKPAAIPDDPPTVTYCGKKLMTMRRNCVNSIEAASCIPCIKLQQANR